MITFYDIPSTLPSMIWSSNTIQARMVLNYKRLPYVTEWVEYPHIESKVREIGGKPTSKRNDGRDLYTLPAIRDTGSDGSKDIVVTDSWAIAEYLDATYPDTPRAFQEGLKAAVVLLAEKYTSVGPEAGAVVRAQVGLCGLLNPESEEYFRRTREEAFGKKLEELMPAEGAQAKCWEDLRSGLKKVAGVYRKNNMVLEDGCAWFFGKTFSFADCVTVAYFVWVRAAFGRESAEWIAIESIADGFWGKQVKRAEEKGLLLVK